MIRNRTFFFGNWEEFHYTKSTPNIGHRCRPPRSAAETFPTFEARAEPPVIIYNPNTTRANPSGSGFIRDLFPGNVIPSNLLDPVGLNISKFYPLPNRAPSNVFTNSNNYQQTGTEHRFMRQYTMKVDHKFNDKNSLFGRFSYFEHKTDNANSIYSNPLIAFRYDDLENRNFTLSDTHTFTPSLINEFRIGFTRSHFPFASASYQQNIPQQLGFPAVVPQTVFPNIAISGGPPNLGNGTVGLRGSIYWQLTDQITKILGNHSLKIGYDHRLIRGNNLQTSAPSGTFNFDSNLTGNPALQAGTGNGFASLLLGDVATASVTTHVGEAEQSYSASTYVQDDWKASRRLTLNIGLRWDYQQEPVERWNGL